MDLMTELNFIIVIMVMTPFALWGFLKGINLIVTIIKVKQGFYKVKFHLSNFRVKSKWMKPEISSFKELNKDGTLKKSLPFKHEPGMIYFEGNTPCVEYTADNKQIDFSGAMNTPAIEQSTLDNLLQLAFNAGIITGARDEKKNQQLIMVILAISIITLLALAYMMMGGFNPKDIIPKP